jgi:hypothetical protein
MICPVTLGAKSSRWGTYFAALCKVTEPHEVHVFELRRFGGDDVIVVDPRGLSVPPELLDRAEAALAIEHEREDDRRRAGIAERAEADRIRAERAADDEPGEP